LTQNPIFFSILAPVVDARPQARARLLRAPPRAFWHAARLNGAVSGQPAGPKRAGRRSLGAGLIEVLVAMTLAFVLIVGAAEMLTLALGAKRKGDITAALAHAVADRLETLKSRPFDDPALAPGAYAETGRVEPGRSLIASSWRIEDDGEGMKKIALRVRLPGRPGPETTAVAFILRDLGFAP
jgi:hypothetical protein